MSTPAIVKLKAVIVAGRLSTAAVMFEDAHKILTQSAELHELDGNALVALESVSGLLVDLSLSAKELGDDIESNPELTEQQCQRCGNIRSASLLDVSVENLAGIDNFTKHEVLFFLEKARDFLNIQRMF